MSVPRPSRLGTRYRLASFPAVLVVVLPMAAVQSSNAVARGKQSPLVSLYLLNRVPRVELRPLDPASLFDHPDRAPVDLDDGSDVRNLVFFGDGTTAVTIGEGINGAGRIVAVVSDASTIRERHRFEVPNGSWMIALSDDGSRLVVRGEFGKPDEGPMTPIWQVFDTVTGAPIAAVEGNQADDAGHSSAIDRAARRLYRVTFPSGWVSPTTNTRPPTARLIVSDLTTGTEVGRIELPGVRGGAWLDGEPTVVQGTEMQIPGQLSPAIALSPDGRRLAIVHADEDAITLVDTEHSATERTTAFAPRRGWLDRLLGLVSLWSQNASAKMLDGALIDAVFSRDGRSLHVSAITGSVKDEQPVFRSLGLRVVEVESGEVIGDGMRDWSVSQVTPAPDGSGVYVLASGPREGTSLWRPDATSLDVLAQRTYGDVPQLVAGR